MTLTTLRVDRLAPADERDIAAQRMQRHAIAGAPFRSIEEVPGWPAGS